MHLRGCLRPFPFQLVNLTDCPVLLEGIFKLAIPGNTDNIKQTQQLYWSYMLIQVQQQTDRMKRKTIDKIEKKDSDF